MRSNVLRPHPRLSGLLITPTVALMLAACGSSGSPGSQQLGVDLQGTIVGVDSRTYTCSVAINWSNVQGPIAAIGAGIDSRNGWVITVTKNATYTFEATCNGRTDETLPTASGSSAKVRATVAQSSRNIAIRVHPTS